MLDGRSVHEAMGWCCEVEIPSYQLLGIRLGGQHEEGGIEFGKRSVAEGKNGGVV